MTKKVVLAFDGDKLTVDPDFCTHEKAYLSSDEGDGVLLYCPHCKSTLDEEMNIVIRGDEPIQY